MKAPRQQSGNHVCWGFSVGILRMTSKPCAESVGLKVHIAVNRIESTIALHVYCRLLLEVSATYRHINALFAISSGNTRQNVGHSIVSQRLVIQDSRRIK